MVKVKTVITIIAILLLSTSMVFAKSLGGAVLLNEQDAQKIFAPTTGVTNSVQSKTIAGFFKGQFQIAIYQKNQPVITQTISELSFDALKSKDLIDAYIEASVDANSLIEAQEIVLPDAKLGVSEQQIEKNKQEVRDSINQLTKLYILTYLTKYGDKPSQNELLNQIQYLVTKNQNELNKLNTELKTAEQELRELNGKTITTPNEAVNNELAQYLSADEGLTEEQISTLLKTSNVDPQVLKDVQKEIDAAKKQAGIVVPKLRKLGLDKITESDAPQLIQLIDASRTMQKMRAFAKFEKYFATPNDQRKEEDFQKAQLELLKYYQNDPEVLLAIQTNNALAAATPAQETKPTPTKRELTTAQNKEIEELKKDIYLQEKILRDYADLVDDESKQITETAGTKLADDYQKLAQIISTTEIENTKATELLAGFKDSTFYSTMQKLLNIQSTPDYFVVIYPAKYAAEKNTTNPAASSITQFKPMQIIAEYAKTSNALIRLNNGLAQGKNSVLNGLAFASPLGTYSEQNLNSLFYNKGYAQGGFKVIQAVYYTQDQLDDEDDLKGQTNILITPIGRSTSLYQIPVEITFSQVTASTFKATRQTQLQNQLTTTDLRIKQLENERDEKITNEGQNAYNAKYQEVLLKFQDNPDKDAVKVVAQGAAINARSLVISKIKRNYNSQIQNTKSTLGQLQSTYESESTQTTDVPVVQIKLPIPNYAIKQLSTDEVFSINSKRLQLIAGNAKYQRETPTSIPELKTRTYQIRLSSIVDYQKPGDYRLEITYLATPLKTPSLKTFVRVEGNGVFEIYTPNNDAARLYGASTKNRDLIVYSAGMKQFIPSSELYLTTGIGKTLDPTDLTGLVKIKDISFSTNKIQLTQYTRNPATNRYDVLPSSVANAINFNTKLITEKYEFTPQLTRNNGVMLQVQNIASKTQMCTVIQVCQNNKLSITFTMPAQYTKLKVQQKTSSATTTISKTQQQFTVSDKCDANLDYYALSEDEKEQQKCEVPTTETVQSVQQFFPYGIENRGCTNQPIRAVLVNLKYLKSDHDLIDKLHLRSQYESDLEYYLAIIQVNPLLLQMPESNVDEITSNLNIEIQNQDTTDEIKIFRKDDTGALVFIKVIPTEVETLLAGTYSVKLYNGDEEVTTFGRCDNAPVTINFGEPRATSQSTQNTGETPATQPVTQTPIDEILDAPKSKIVDPFVEEINTRIEQKQKAAFNINAPGVDECNLNSKIPLLDLISQRIPDNAKYFYVYTGATATDYPIATLFRTPNPSQFSAFYSTNPGRYNLNRPVPLTIQFKDEKDKTLLTLCGQGPLQK